MNVMEYYIYSLHPLFIRKGWMIEMVMRVGIGVIVKICYDDTEAQISMIIQQT